MHLLNQWLVVGLLQRAREEKKKNLSASETAKQECVTLNCSQIFKHNLLTLKVILFNCSNINRVKGPVYLRVCVCVCVCTRESECER